MIFQQGVSARHLVVLSILLGLSLLGETNTSCLVHLKNRYKLAEHQANVTLESFQTVFNLSPSTEEICPDILKHVIHVSDIKKTLKNLYLYRYRLAKVLQYHEDLSYPHFLLQNLNELNGTMSRAFDLIAALSIKFQKPPKPEEFNDGDHVKKIYGWCVLYRIKNILKEGNPIVQSLSMTDVCHKLNHQRVPTHLSTCC